MCIKLFATLDFSLKILCLVLGSTKMQIKNKTKKQKQKQKNKTKQPSFQMMKKALKILNDGQLIL